MDEAKVTVLYDEGALEGTNFIGARGFSMLIEVDGERTLFGAGRRNRYLASNMYEAGIDNDTIARLVVSHGHPDHWAGYPAVLYERKETLKVFAPVSAWGEKTLLGATGIVINNENKDKVIREDVVGWLQLSEHLFISAPVKFHEGSGTEIFMVIKSRNGPVLISGCCHCGLDNICEEVNAKFGSYPVAILGGLHIEKKQDHLSDLYAEYIQRIGCRVLYLNHCTGLQGIGRMRVTLGLKGIEDFYVGQSATFQVF